MENKGLDHIAKVGKWIREMEVEMAIKRCELEMKRLKGTPPTKEELEWMLDLEVGFKKMCANVFGCGCGDDPQAGY